MSADALRYGRAVELDSMSAVERRVVHVYLQDRPEVETHSEGDEPYRCIVITPVRGGPWLTPDRFTFYAEARLCPVAWPI